MAIQPGTRLGRYEIRALIGSGGMGEVYRAHDGQLGREVAVKVLPAAIGEDPVLLERFEREARAVAALAHPNILTIFDFGIDGGHAFAAMELLEGGTLRDRIQEGPIPARKAAEIARQLAEALAAAHHRGVVHRDIKPENIFLTADGHVKVLDFGLALDAGVLEDAGNDTQAHTHSSLTTPGTVMGTAGYMAPEQVRGETADARTDIFAFGCVLYEMLSGRSAFKRDSVADTMTAILRDDPPELDTGPGGSAALLERVARRCLEKNPIERFQSARDLAFAVQTASTSSGAAPIPRARRVRGGLWWLPWLATAVLTGFLAVVVLRPAAPPPVIVSDLVPPAGCLFNPTDGPPAMSPDGRRIAFLAGRPGEASHLFVRSLAETEAVRLDDTSGAMAPFWSPDGQFLAFFAGGMLKKAEIDGGEVVDIAAAPKPNGGSWSIDGTIMFIEDVLEPPRIVDAEGGEVRPVVDPFPGGFETWWQWPEFLPDGDHFLVAVQDLGGKNSGIHVGSLRDPAGTRRLTRTISRAVYADPGWVLFWEGGDLKAHRFDTRTLELGDSHRVATGVGWGQYMSYGRFDVSDNGALVYQRGEGAIGDSELVMVDRTGTTVGVVGERAEYYSPRLSHDGERIAVDITDIQTTNGDVWVLEPGRGTRTRLTRDERDESDPVWTPDDREVIYRRVPDLYRRDRAAADREVTLLESAVNKQSEDISPDGRQLLFEVGVDRDDDLWVLDLESGEARPWLDGPFREDEGRFSPDGSWIAYQSDETGRLEVSVRSFPGGLDRIVVSAAGGSSPVWRPDGSELFYYSLASEITAVAVTWSEGTPQFGEPRPLFNVRLRSGEDCQFDVSPDGGTFLLNRLVSDVENQPMTLVQGWDSGLIR